MVLPIAEGRRRGDRCRPLGCTKYALALGATRWEMIRMAGCSLRQSGIISTASMLGLGRALGELLAVAMVLSPAIVINFFLLRAESNTIA
jgi:phosphate transport system permease protein